MGHYFYESSNSDHLSETILDIRDAKWFIYIRMPLYPSISIIWYNLGSRHRNLTDGPLVVALRTVQCTPVFSIIIIILDDISGKNCMNERSTKNY